LIARILLIRGSYFFSESVKKSTFLFKPSGLGLNAIFVLSWPKSPVTGSVATTLASAVVFIKLRRPKLPTLTSSPAILAPPFLLQFYFYASKVINGEMIGRS
jgi:hypothetical protein